MHPQNPASQLDLGRAYEEAGRTTDAERAYRAALALSPRYPAAHYNLANLHQVTLRGLVEYSTQSWAGHVERSYRYSLFPDYNMLPLRIERLRKNGTVRIRYDQSDFREIQPGVWYPHSSVRYHLRRDNPPIVIKMKIEEVEMGDEVEIPAELPFPTGAIVRDDAADTKRLVIAAIAAVCGLILVVLFLKSVFSAKKNKGIDR